MTKVTKDLVEIMDEVALSEEEVLVSVDVKSLFTNIPVDEAISICEERLKGDDTVEKRTKTKVGTIVKLRQFCLKSTEIVHGRVHYKPLDGIARGSPVSPVVADIFMDELEKKAFDELEAPPRIWHRFVDDNISVINSSDEAVLFDHLNEQHPRITFTMKREYDGKMPFMDVLFKRGEEDQLDRAAYRKPTHTGRCLSVDCLHPASVKCGILREFVIRAIKVCSDEESKKVEIEHIMTEMQGNGYPKKSIQRAARDQLKEASVTPPSSKDSKDVDTNKEEWQKARIPFIEGVSYEVRRIARDAGINCLFYQPHTLGGLYNVKNRLQSGTQGDVVYSVKCETCQAKYVGETMRALEVRSKEHRDAIRLNHPEKSAITEHVLGRNGSHDINGTNVRVIDRATGMKERNV